MYLNDCHKKYVEWCEDNQDVFDLIQHQCLRLLARKQRFSIDAVVHYVRFNEFFREYRDEPYRISNNHTAYIAREMIAKYPDSKKYSRTCKVNGETDATRDDGIPTQEY